MGVIRGVSGSPEGLVEGVEAVDGRVMGVGDGGCMGIALLIALGLAVHLVKAVLLLRDSPKWWIEGFLA